MTRVGRTRARRLRPWAVLLVVALGLAAPATAGAFALVSVAPGVKVSGLAAGPDGQMWFTDPDRELVRRVGRDGRVRTVFRWPAGAGEPYGIAKGADGAMWVLDFEGRWVQRLTADGVSTVFPTGLTRLDGGFTSSLVAAPDGSLWFQAGARIGRITTAGQLRWFDVPGRPGQSGHAALGPDGRVWFVGDTTVVAVAPEGTIRSYALPSVLGWGDAAIAAGPDGRMWLAGRSGLVRVAVDGRADMVPSGPFESAFGAPSFVSGPAGHLWLAQPESGRVAEITAVGRVTLRGPGLAKVVGPDAFPAGALAVGPGNELWVAGEDGLSRAILHPACVVPRIVQLSLATARLRLRKAGCGARVPSAGPAGSAAHPVGVVRQGPRAGTVLAPGARVTLSVGRLAPICRFPEGAVDVVRSATARVATRKLRTPAASDRDQTTQTWWGCLTARPGLRRLEQVVSYPLEDPGTIVSDFELVGTRVTYVVAAFTGHYGSGTTSIVTQNLASTAAPVRIAASESRDFDDVHRVAVHRTNRAGTVAWVTSYYETLTLDVQTAAGRRTRLAEGAAGSITDLRIDDRTVFWRQDGQERSAPIPAV